MLEPSADKEIVVSDRGSQYFKDWDWYARLVEQRKDGDEWALPRGVRESHWAEFFDVAEGDRVLEAGCGHGDYAVLALREGAQVSAFDYFPEMVEATNSRLQELELVAADLRKASVTEIPYSDDSFDVTLCLAVLDHIPNQESINALHELRRVTRRDGMIYLGVPNRFAYHWRLAIKLMQRFGLYPKGDTRYFSPGKLKSIVREAGLQPEKSLGLWLLPPFSAVYTTDFRRRTFLPDSIARVLDRVFFWVEIHLRRVPFLKPLCFHYFIACRNQKD